MLRKQNFRKEINFWRDLKDRVLEKSPRGFEENPENYKKTYKLDVACVACRMG